MNKDFVKYEVEIKDEEFLLDNKVIANKTAILKLYEDDKNFKTHNLANISKDDLLHLSVNKNILLKNAYIDGFPDIIGEYNKIIIKSSFIISDKFKINSKILEEISFQKTIFLADEIDFSDTVFNTDANFSDTFFKAEIVKFSNCIFNEGLNFKNSKFESNIKLFDKIDVISGEFNFANTDFGKGNVSFQESKLGTERKTFTMCRFSDGFIDFTRTKFGHGDVFFERTHFGEGNLTFRSADFGNGTVDFRRAEFGCGEKNFMHTTFGNGSVKFVNSIFKGGKITFRLADFGKGDVDFHYTKFGNTDVFFERTLFNSGDLNFRGVEIGKGKLNFNHLDFGDGDFIFESLEIQEGTFYLKNSVFGRGFINFENAICQNSDFILENVDFGYGSVSFQNATFKEIRLKGSQINSYFDFRLKKCQLLDLSNTVINDVLDLSPAQTGLNVQTLYLQGVRLLGRIYLDWERSDVKKLIYNQNASNYEKSEQFRILKENYRNMGLYEYEDKAYVEFKRTESKAKLAEIRKKKLHKRLRKTSLYWMEILIFDKMGHYATNPVRVLRSMGIAYLLFSFIYLALEYVFPKKALILSSLFSPDSPQVMSNIAKAFYHSAITFLTIGYGDYYPVGIIRVLSSIEGFVGLFLMSYFTVAFVRKILR
ncbi:MAG: hypothetical protein JXR68_11210 [Bacteroidales bacterium]|nr:hypothetical protein [Bacteroidales bacterium]